VKHIPKRKMRAEQKKRRELSLPVSTELGDLIKKLTDAKKSKGEVTKSAPKSAPKLTSGAQDPVNLITENSALGRAFKNLRKNKGSPSDSSSSSSDSDNDSDTESTYSRGSDSGSSSSSDSSSSDSSSSSSSSDDSNGHERVRGSKRKHRRRKSKKRSNKKNH